MTGIRQLPSWICARVAPFSSRMEVKYGSIGFDFAGTYTKIVEHKLIEYSFGDRMAQVEFTPGPKASASASPLTANRRIPSSSSKEGGRPFSTISPGTLKRIKGNCEGAEPRVHKVW